MSNQRPLWLLDIDGVVNIGPKGASPWPDEPSEVFVQLFQGEGFAFPFKYSQMLLEEIERLAEEYDVEVRISSTWCGYGADLKSKLGLPYLDAFGRREAWQNVDELKMNAVDEALGEGRPTIWTDDVVPMGHWITAESSPELDKKICVIVPLESEGLTPFDINHIETFLKGLK
jgi:hypothetical protein